MPRSSEEIDRPIGFKIDDSNGDGPKGVTFYVIRPFNCGDVSEQFDNEYEDDDEHMSFVLWLESNGYIQRKQ